MVKGVRKVREQRMASKDAFFFNWSLRVPADFQHPFHPTHEAMAGLDLHRARPPHELAASLRRAFSGIVAGNVKEEGMREIEQRGPFEIHGDPEIMQALDALLRAFVDQRRMKMVGEYQPCYRVIG
jgi:pyrimidine/purine-5'-nucleotide nucleosidase